MEFPENGLNEDHKILHAYLWTIDRTNLPDMTSLALSGRLQNAIILNKSQLNVSCWSKSRIIQLLFNLESPNFAGTSLPTDSAAIPDMTSPATSGRHL